MEVTSQSSRLFLANDIDDDIKVPALIVAIGVQGYKTVQYVFSPADPRNQTYDALCDALEQYYSPKPVQLAERFRLHKLMHSRRKSNNNGIYRDAALTQSEFRIRQRRPQ